jgi:transposase
MSQVTIISCVERRRVWTDEQKRALVAEIARRSDLRPSQLFRWRCDLAEPATPGFAALTVSHEPAPVAAGAAVVLEVGGAVLWIAADAPPALVAAAVRSLRR